MFTKHKLHYTIEMLSDESYIFVCSYSSFSEAEAKLKELKDQTDADYRILKIEKDTEEVS